MNDTSLIGGQTPFAAAQQPAAAPSQGSLAGRKVINTKEDINHIYNKVDLRGVMLFIALIVEGVGIITLVTCFAPATPVLAPFAASLFTALRIGLGVMGFTLIPISFVFLGIFYSDRAKPTERDKYQDPNFLEWANENQVKLTENNLSCMFYCHNHSEFFAWINENQVELSYNNFLEMLDRFDFQDPEFRAWASENEIEIEDSNVKCLFRCYQNPKMFTWAQANEIKLTDLAELISGYGQYVKNQKPSDEPEKG